MMASHKFACMVAVMCIVVVSAPMLHAAITCGQVTRAIAPCMSYLKSEPGGQPQPACCNGVRTLNNAAKTTVDRRDVCKCLKYAAASIPGLNPNNEASLPIKCGVTISYRISPSINCAKVQ